MYFLMNLPNGLTYKFFHHNEIYIITALYPVNIYILIRLRYRLEETVIANICAGI